MVYTFILSAALRRPALRLDRNALHRKAVLPAAAYPVFPPRRTGGGGRRYCRRVPSGRVRMALTGEPHLNVKMKKGEDIMVVLHQMFGKYTEFAQRADTQEE